MMETAEEVKLISLLKEKNYKQTIENLMDFIIAGKNKIIEQFIDSLNQSSQQEQNSFLISLVEILKQKRKLAEYSNPTIVFIKSISEKGYLVLANKIIKNLPLYSLRSKGYSAVAYAFESKGKRNEALQYLEKAIENANKINAVKEKSESLSQIVILIAKQDRLDSALELLNMIGLDSEISFSSKKILPKIINLSDKSKKMSYLTKLAEITSKIKDEKIKSDCFVYITRAMIKFNMIKEALELARQIKDEKAKISTLGVIIDVMTKHGLKGKAKNLVKEAEQAVSQIKNSNNEKTEALSEIIEAQIKVDMIDKALSVSEEVKDAGWKAMNTTLIAEAMAKNGYTEKAINLLIKSLSLIEHIHNSGNQTTVLSSVAEVLSLLDEEEEQILRPVFDKIINILYSINEENVMYAFLNYICNLDFLNKYSSFKEDIEKYINSIENSKIKSHLNFMLYSL